MDNSKHGTIPMQETLDLNKTQGASKPKETGYIFVLNRGAVEWKSSKQSTTTMSATKAEYIAALEAAMEAIWIRMFISELAALEAAMEAIWIRMFISELDDNLADPITKALPKGKLTQHARSMGLRLASSFM
nr:hypothetical protein [Tanacetum cinerariifolium]